MSRQTRRDRRGVTNIPDTLKRYEVVDHLNHFLWDIDRYTTVLPGILCGVPFSDVVQSSLELTKQVKLLKGALLEAMLREGLSPVRDADCPPLSQWLESSGLASPPPVQRLAQCTARVRGDVPFRMEDYLRAINSRETVTSERSQTPQWSQSYADESTRHETRYQNQPDPRSFFTPIRPPRNAEGVVVSPVDPLSPPGETVHSTPVIWPRKQRPPAACEPRPQ